MISLIFSLNIFVGLGYDLSYDFKYEEKDIKGIVTVESENGTFGFIHASGLDNGTHGSSEDQNLFYIKLKIN